VLLDSGVMESTLLIGWTTVETEDAGRELANGMVRRGLAACVQIDGPIRSIFPWKGEVEDGQEYRLTVKFPENLRPELLKFIREQHPYETPEWVVFPAAEVNDGYMSWVLEVTGGAS